MFRLSPEHLYYFYEWSSFPTYDKIEEVIKIKKIEGGWMKNRRSDISVLVGILLSLILTGTFGYKILLDISLIDALYMTVITISTVGYGEIGVMNMEAKIFSIILIFISLGTVGYLFSSIVSSLLEGDIRKVWRMRKMEREIKNMEKHYIICGAGENGYNAIKQFMAHDVDFIVIDKKEERVEELREEGIHAICGDASQEDILRMAGIDRAKGLISSLPSDAENVYTVLTARQINSDLYIVARSIEKEATGKLIKAGANNTISPDEIGGTRMASLMLRPNVMAFLDVITHAGEVILDLEEVEILEDSELIDKKLKESKIPEKTGLIVLAIKKYNSEKLHFNPSSSERLEKGDTMIVLGKKEQVDLLKVISGGLEK